MCNQPIDPPKPIQSKLTHRVYSFILFLSSFILFLTSIFLNEKCYVHNILRNTFTTKFIWKIVINFNLNPPLKLFFYLPILTNNNLTLKIYCENIVVEFLRTFYNLYYFSFFHFILLHTRVQRAKGEKKRWVRLSKGQSRRRSAFTMQHYHVPRPTAARPPSHHQVGLDRLFYIYIYIYMLVM